MARLSDSERIRKMVALRDEIRAVKKHLKVKEDKLAKLEDSSIELLLSKSIELIRSPYGSISIHSEDVAQVEDWEKVYRYVKRNDAFYLMYKRILNTAWRDEIATRRNKPIPGINAFTRWKLSLLTGKKDIGD